MKAKAILNIMSVLLLCLLMGCTKANKEYTITGRIVKSCNNTKPLAGLSLSLFYYGSGHQSAMLLQEVATDNEGKFKFVYEGKVLDNSLSIKGTSPDGISQREYMGLPVNQNLEVGTLYADSNFFCKVMISVQRPTSVNDTLYFRSRNQKYLKKIIGPFTDNQVIDTLISHWSTNTNGEGPKISYQWQLGSKKDQTTIRYAETTMHACEWQQMLLEVK